MTLAQIQGNSDVCRALAGMVRSGRVPHAILFHEDDGGGAFPIVLAFLQLLYCTSPEGGDSCGVCPSCNKISKLIHPDVHFVFPTNAQDLSVNYAAKWRSLVLSNPTFTEAELAGALGLEGKSSIIAVTEARAMLDTLSLSALEGGYRSVVIYLPEKMNQEAANRLLKIIEEPPLKTQFLLVTHAPEKVLRTISSRCQSIRVCPSGKEDRIGTAETEAVYSELFARLMDSLASRNLLESLEAGDALAALPSREAAKGFCLYASARLRRIFLYQQNFPQSGEPDADVERWASKARKTFPRQSLEILDRAYMHIGRNVNLKILFADLVGRLYRIYG